MKKKIVFFTVQMILFGIMLYCGWKLWEVQDEYSTADEYYEELAQNIEIPETAVKPKSEVREDMDTDKSTDTDIDIDTDTDWPVVDFEALAQDNQDIVAWIYIEDTSVNYPVVQGEDNSYYLNRLIDRTENRSGSIFLDCDSESDFTGKNSIIYGHNMKNGAMFHNLINYKEQEYYDEHPEALLITPQGNYKVILFSGYVANVSDSAWDLFFAEESYAQWLNEISKKSCFVSDVMPEVTDRIVTLSTCSYEFDNARFVLHGVIK